jgi:SAM-dependent methyltransferase
MNWRLKGTVQKILGALPRGGELHYFLQRHAGGLKDFDRELAMKLDDFTLMAGHFRSVRMPIEGSRFLEMGSGWYTTLPLCLYFAGAESVETLDLERHLRPELLLACASRLVRFADLIAEAGGRRVQDVSNLQQATVRALQRGASLEDATRGVVRYRAPADASATGHADGTLDVVFSNSVLEHVPGPAIERCFAEARRILREGGIIFHAANCGDHYAYIDRSITQLNYLRYSDRAWQKWNNAFLYQNRLRAEDFTKMARAAGFTIEVDTSRPHPNRLAELEAIDVHPRFERYSRAQLAITSIDFVGRKSERHTEGPS